MNLMPETKIAKPLTIVQNGRRRVTEDKNEIHV
jgi:hypothetical protein